jgi:ectoine hydroxylase-related dioxygenase (phytanoyl-CoA dioxygenase family)
MISAYAIFFDHETAFIRREDRMALTQTQLDYYQTQGYLIPDWRFAAADIAKMRAAVDGIIAANPDHRPEQLVCPHLDGGATKPIKGHYHEAFLGFAATPGLRALVAGLLGPQVLLWGSQLFCKPAATGMALPWHQDGDYWPIRPMATMSAWIAIDPAGPDNGGLRLIPGSHAGGPLPHEHDDRDNIALDQTIQRGRFDLNAAIDVDLMPGQLVLFDVHMVHGSNANTSGCRRAGLVYRFMPSTSLFDRSTPDKTNSSGHLVSYGRRPLYQVVGDDPGANSDVYAMPQ